MKHKSSRREFIQTSLLAGAGLGLASRVTAAYRNSDVTPGKRVGMIGLDTSHVIAVTNALNGPEAGADWDGYRVVAAYPTEGSADMEASIGRLAGFTKQVKNSGVEIVDSIDELLEKVDVVLLESVDGRRHLAEALPVLKSGKMMFIDKPLAASLEDAMVIFDAAKKYNVPVFSASSLRYITGAEEIVEGKIGKVIGADTYGDCYIEPNHPDLVYYGIHGIEMLYALMGTGCKSVVRIHQEDTDMVVGTWQEGRIGSYRGTRSGTRDFGATVFGETGIDLLNKSAGYDPLWQKIIEFFNSGIVPVSPEETLEEFAFMAAAEESKLHGGASIDLEMIITRAEKKVKDISL